MNTVDIIIPTYNRTDLLKRVLDYYQEYGREFNFIVADSSNPKNKKQNCKLVKSYTTMKILYLDKFSDTLIQSRKFGEMVKYAKSKYCVFCADDDFIVPSGLRKAIAFLEKNPDYVAAHGTYIGFHLFKSIIGSSSFWWKFRHAPQSISSSNPLLRLNDLLTTSTQIIWSVRRTSVVKACYQEFMKVNIDPYLLPILGELLPDALTVIFGKAKSLNTFYSARQYFGSVISYYPSLTDAKNAGIFDKEYSKVKKCLTDNIAKREKVTRIHIANTIDSAIETHIKFSYQQHLMGRINFILKYFPSFVSKAVRLLHVCYLFSTNNTNKIGNISDPSSLYFEDFNKVRQCVIRHNIV